MKNKFNTFNCFSNGLVIPKISFYKFKVWIILKFENIFSFSGCKIISKEFEGNVWSQEVDFSELPEIEPLEMKMDVKIKPGKNGLSVGVLSLNAKRLTTASQPPEKGAK